ncbi:MAG: family 1 glycosylhydrolase [Clostridia bacterium]|nr:family 1 glycosylhydrolase [Clostridia bacterium]
MKKDFLWGVSTAAGQIEGSVLEDGRGLSIWDAFCRIPGSIANNDTTDVACSSYKLWREDVKLLKDLGVNSYRYSISWSRVLPAGKGKINQAGLDYYKRLTDTLLNEGIAPNITLYHWDLPYELHRLGGWLNRDVADWFADYAEIIFKEIPDAYMFSTHNEPIATYVGYAKKVFAPGFAVEEYGRQANHNLLLSHGKAVERFRASNSKAKIGIVIDVWNRVPLDPKNEDDVKYAKEQNALAHGNYLSPIFSGKYNDIYLSYLEKNNIKLQTEQKDFELISAPLDFFGLNCYNRMVVSASGANVRQTLTQNGGNFLQNGQEYYPDAIYDTVKIIRKDFNVNLPIYITENGVGFKNEQEVDGIILDDERIKYLTASFNSIKRLLDEGEDVRGYYLWSLLDNFEWTAGYSTKYGIHTIDRKPKKSALFYKEHIKNNG